MSATHCPACHHAWTEHPGLVATCAKLQQAERNVELLRAALREANADRVRLVAKLAGMNDGAR